MSREEEDAKILGFIMDRISTESVMNYYDKVPHGNLGSGSFGQVWKGESYDDGAIYAIKTIKGAQERALGREIKVMLEAKHENLLPVHKIFKTGDTLHLVMDLIEPLPGLKQSDLFEWIITKGPLNTTDACKLLYQCASALKYLNDRMIIHRDLKPENILLGADRFDRIRLMDYGLARCFMEGDSLDVTEATANIGSGGYQAPETIARNKQTTQYGKECDVWSLGVILYICVRGAPPFGLGPKARMADIMKGKYAAMTGKKWDVVDPKLRELIGGRMMGPGVVDPRNRITVEEILQDDFVCRNAGVDPLMKALTADIDRVASEASQ